MNGLAYASLFTFGFLFQTSCANQTRKRREISTHPNFDGRWKNDQIEWARGQGEVTSQQKALEREGGWRSRRGHERGWGSRGGHKPSEEISEADESWTCKAARSWKERRYQTAWRCSAQSDSQWRYVTLNCGDLRVTKKSVHMHCCVPVVFDLFYSIGLWSFCLLIKFSRTFT